MNKMSNFVMSINRDPASRKAMQGEEDNQITAVLRSFTRSGIKLVSIGGGQYEVQVNTEGRWKFKN